VPEDLSYPSGVCLLLNPGNQVMSEPTEGPTAEQVVAEISAALSEALTNQTKCLGVVRCTGAREVDHARESLIRSEAPFAWKSLPAAQLEPPDLMGYILHYATAEGPAFLVYGLPKGRDGRVLKRFIELLLMAEKRYEPAPYLMVMILTLDEIKDVSRHAPSFWRTRDKFLGWPVSSAAGSFVPAVIGSRTPARQRSAVARRGGGVNVAGGGVSGVGGKVSAAQALRTGGHGDPVVDGDDPLSEQAMSAPWAGAPFREGDVIPRYILDADPPAGRRWGRDLAGTDEEGATLIDKCRALLDQHQTEYARQGLAKAAKRFRSASNGPATAECFVLLGRASELRFDHTVALEWYEQAISVYEQLGDDAGVSDCCNLIGYLRFMHGDLDGAFSFFDRALRRDEEAGDQLRTASGYRRIGIILEQRQEYSQANGLYERAADIERENGDQFALSRSLHHQSRVHALKGRYKDALSVLRQSLVLKEELGDDGGLASAYHEMGNLEFRQNNMEEALEAYEKAFELEEQLLDTPGIAVTQAQIGLVRKEMFHFADAVRSFGIARDLFHRLQSPYVQTLEAALQGAREMVDADVYKEMLVEAEEYVAAILVAE
jgi:tetratricopeptide (TPR) repeat protein